MEMKVKVHKRLFAVAKLKDLPSNDFFAVVKYDGVTVVLQERELERVRDEVVECERGFGLLTFDATLPFDLVGFIARVSAALAEKGVSVLVFSSYSTDHILVRDKDLSKALNALKGMGFDVDEADVVGAG